MYELSNFDAIQIGIASPEKIKEYVDTYQPFDKAGAYGIQDGFVVKSYAGSYDNIVGLPTEKLKEILGG